MRLFGTSIQRVNYKRVFNETTHLITKSGLSPAVAVVKGAMLIGKHLKTTAPLCAYVWRKNQVRAATGQNAARRLCNTITPTCRKLIK